MTDTPTTPPVPTPDTPPPTPPATPPATPSDATYSKDDVERMIQERLAKAAKRHQDELSKVLGDRDADTVAAILQEHDEAVEARKTEHEKAVEAAAKAQAEADAAADQARRTELRAALTMALVAPGSDPEGNPLSPVQRDYLDTVLDLALPAAMASEADDPVADAVAKVRQSAAPMFAESTPTPEPAPGSTRPAPTPQRPHSQNRPTGKSPAETGIERYKRMKGIKDDAE